MFKEYALDPQVLRTWTARDFDYFLEGFAISEGRLVSRYPGKSWLRDAIQAIPADTFGQAKRNSVVARLRRMKESGALFPRGGQYENSQDWLSNAVMEDARMPFHAIVATERLDGHPRVAISYELNEDHPLWKVSTQDYVPREPRAMASRLNKLFVCSRELVLIDPHFHPARSRFTEPLAEFLRCFRESWRGGEQCPARVEYHVETPSEPDAYRRLCQERLPALVPPGWSLEVKAHRKKSLHDRYVLTDIGGAKFGIGLDRVTGTGTEEVSVQLLEENEWTTEWRKCRNVETFCVVPEVFEGMS